MRDDVIKYEKILDETVELYDSLEEILLKIKDNQESLIQLKEYYNSEEYMNDVDISNTTSKYDDISCGILSQDAAYNLIVQVHDNAIEMLEIATNILKN